ncbi:MAG: glycosyltransferase family 9 protein [bacterium]|nr:glycosyltransferase family 9 protein [bacterium]
MQGGSMDGNLTRKIDGWVGLVICAVLFLHSRLRARLGGAAQPAMHDTTPPRRGRAPLVPARVLCIKTYGLGNIAMILPVLGAVRRAFPDSEIDFLSLEENRSLLEHSALVNEVIPLSTRGVVPLVTSLARAFVSVRRRRYDLVLDFEQFIKLSTIIAYASGAPERIGFNTDGQRRGWLFTTRIVYNDADHMSQTFMRLLRPLDIDPQKHPVAFEHSADARASVERLLGQHGAAGDTFPVIAVHVGSGPNYYRVPLKRWPTEHFARLCDELVAKHGATVVLTGKSEDEAVLVRETLAQMRQPAINGCDALSIPELLALLDRCNFTISNDTSVVHLSAAVGTPVVAFFGPTNPGQYGPGNEQDLVIYKDLFCGPCLTNYNLKVSYCADPVCIRTITVEQVLERIESHYLAEDAVLGAAVGNPDARPRPRFEVVEGSAK